MNPQRALSIGEVLQEMQGGQLYLAVTSEDAGAPPYVSTLSWVAAREDRAIHLALDRRSRTLANIRANGSMQLIYLGAEGCHVLTGTAQVGEDPMANVSLPVARVIFTPASVRDALHFGSRLSTPPATEPTYDASAAERLDAQVIAALAGN